jgi:hypothetical protein
MSVTMQRLLVSGQNESKQRGSPTARNPCMARKSPNRSTGFFQYQYDTFRIQEMRFMVGFYLVKSTCRKMANRAF